MKGKINELATANAILDINRKFDLKLRDLFAMGIIAGMSSNIELNNLSLEYLAELAYKQADAMLKARKK